MKVPRALSFLAFHDFNAKVQGLDAVPAADRPPVNVVRYAFQTMVGIGTLLAFLGLFYLFVRLRWKRLPETVWFYRALVLAGPLSVVALIAGWVTTEVGRQPWVVYGFMRTEQAVTGAGPIPWGYAALVIVYVLVARRGRLDPAPPRRLGGDGMTLQDVPILFILAGLVAYVVLAGPDFGAAIWQVTAQARRRGRARCATSPTTRWRRSGRPTTCG